jgi:hypothetical protein
VLNAQARIDTFHPTIQCRGAIAIGAATLTYPTAAIAPKITHHTPTVHASFHAIGDAIVTRAAVIRVTPCKSCAVKFIVTIFTYSAWIAKPATTIEVSLISILNTICTAVAHTKSKSPLSKIFPLTARIGSAIGMLETTFPGRAQTSKARTLISATINLHKVRKVDQQTVNEHVPSLNM